MKTLSWNYQGLGNPWTVQDFYHMVKEKRPNLVFLMETKMNNSKCEKNEKKIVERVGRKGGLIMF